MLHPSHNSFQILLMSPHSIPFLSLFKEQNKQANKTKIKRQETPYLYLSVSISVSHTHHKNGNQNTLAKDQSDRGKNPKKFETKGLQK